MLSQTDYPDSDMPQEQHPYPPEDAPYDPASDPLPPARGRSAPRRTRVSARQVTQASRSQRDHLSHSTDPSPISGISPRQAGISPRESGITAPLPAHTPIPTAAILDSTLPAQALQALARLYAAAEPTNYEHTAPLDFDRQLVPLLHASRTQVRNTLRLLRLAKLIHWSSDGANRYTIHLLSPANQTPDQADSIDDVRIDSPQNLIRQHHPTESGEPETGSGYLTVLDCLLRAGVWTDAALRIDAQITANVRRGHTYLPDLRDVLGWIAFCFAYQRQNKLSNPSAVLAANLNANRRCPEVNRPPYICSQCRRDEAHCACPDPDLRIPPKFLDYAFSDEFDERSQSFWGVCHRCHAFPCACVPGEQGAEPPEGDEEYPRGDTRGW